jgi:hypothetical protein
MGPKIFRAMRSMPPAKSLVAARTNGDDWDKKNVPMNPTLAAGHSQNLLIWPSSSGNSLAVPVRQIVLGLLHRAALLESDCEAMGSIAADE